MVVSIVKETIELPAVTTDANGNAFVTKRINLKYKAAFKQIAPKYKLKNGKWKKGGFKAAVKAAHAKAGGKK